MLRQQKPNRFVSVAYSQSTMVAKRFIRSFNRQNDLLYTFDDLVQEGMIISLKACKKYDKTFGYSFKTLCQVYITNHLLNLLSSIQQLSRNPGEQIPLDEVQETLDHTKFHTDRSMSFFGDTTTVQNNINLNDFIVFNIVEDSFIYKDFMFILESGLSPIPLCVLKCYLEPPEQLIDMSVEHWKSNVRKRARGKNVRGATTIRITNKLIARYLQMTNHGLNKQLTIICDTALSIRKDS